MVIQLQVLYFPVLLFSRPTYLDIRWSTNHPENQLLRDIAVVLSRGRLTETKGKLAVLVLRYQ